MFKVRFMNQLRSALLTPLLNHLRVPLKPRRRTVQAYLSWKTFNVWRKCVRKEKVSGAVKTLQSHLFMLDPVLSASLRCVSVAPVPTMPAPPRPRVLSVGMH